jgi:hypothetical protein
MIQNKNSIFYILVKVVILIIGIFVTYYTFSYSNISSDTSTYLGVNPNNENLFTNFLQNVSPFLYANRVALFQYIHGTAYLIITLVIILLLPGRSVIETAGLLFLFMIPNQRKNWGVILDQRSNKPLPFASILIEKILDDDSTEFLLQRVANMDGRYRLSFQNPKAKVRLTVKADGFQTFVKTISPNSLTSKVNIITDIHLKNLDQKTSLTRRVLHKINYEWINSIIYLVYFLSFILVLLSIAEIGLVTTQLTITQMVMYTIPFIWNTIILYRRFNVRAGKLIDEATGEAIEGAQITIFNTEGEQIGSYFTNKDGIVNFDLEKGTYIMRVSKQGYEYMLDGDNLYSLVKRVEINSKGYLNKNLFLLRSDSTSESQMRSSTLISPFN